MSAHEVFVVLFFVLVIGFCIGMVFLVLEQKERSLLREDFCEDRGYEYEFSDGRSCYKIISDKIIIKPITVKGGVVYWEETG